MSIYPNISEKDLDNLRKLADQQKNDRATKIKNRILKQTHDIKLVESLAPITKKLDTINESTKMIGDIFKESEPSAIEQPYTSQALRDTLTLMKRSKNFFKLEQDGKKVFWNKITIKSLGENRISINDNKEYDINSIIQEYFTNTKQTTKNMNDEDKTIIYNILNDLGFYSTRHSKGTKKSKRFKDAFYNLPNEIAKIQNPPLPAIENESDNLQGEGVKIIILSNIIDIYIRLEILLGLKIAGHSDTLTEASSLLDELYRQGEIQNKHQYRNALNKFQI